MDGGNWDLQISQNSLWFLMQILQNVCCSVGDLRLRDLRDNTFEGSKSCQGQILHDPWRVHATHFCCINCDLRDWRKHLRLLGRNVDPILTCLWQDGTHNLGHKIHNGKRPGSISEWGELACTFLVFFLFFFLMQPFRVFTNFGCTKCQTYIEASGSSAFVYA